MVDAHITLTKNQVHYSLRRTGLSRSPSRSLCVKYTETGLRNCRRLGLSQHQRISFANPPPPEAIVTTHSTARPPSDFPLGIPQFPWHLQRPLCSKRYTPFRFRAITWETVGTLYIRVSSMHFIIIIIIAFMGPFYTHHSYHSSMNPPSTSKKTSLTGIGPCAAAFKSCFVAARFARASCISKTHGQITTKTSRSPFLPLKTLWLAPKKKARHIFGDLICAQSSTRQYDSIW